MNYGDQYVSPSAPPMQELPMGAGGTPDYYSAAAAIEMAPAEFDSFSEPPVREGEEKGKIATKKDKKKEENDEEGYLASEYAATVRRMSKPGWFELFGFTCCLCVPGTEEDHAGNIRRFDQNLEGPDLAAARCSKPKIKAGITRVDETTRVDCYTVYVHTRCQIESGDKPSREFVQSCGPSHFVRGLSLSENPIGCGDLCHEKAGCAVRVGYCSKFVCGDPYRCMCGPAMATPCTVFGSRVCHPCQYFVLGTIGSPIAAGQFLSIFVPSICKHTLREKPACHLKFPHQLNSERWGEDVI